jgi:methylenetetrahydrofolate dehydrogenase (NADP+)/methenyltetrahydrofolate cyclohydrolase
MAAKIINGHEFAERIKNQVASEASQLAARGRRPKLVAVQVAEHPASRIYTRMQEQSCRVAGIEYELVNLPADTSADGLRARIEQLNRDDSVTAMILQMPLPDHLDARQVQTIISPVKDAESVHPSNMGRLFFDDYALAPPAPMAAVGLLRSVQDDLTGKEVVIVGHSEIVGKPIAALLLASRRAAPTVTVCHVATADLAAHTRRAEVLIVATGLAQARWVRYGQARFAGGNPPLPDLRPLITAEHLKKGAIVIDVAVNRIPRSVGPDGEPVKNDNGKPDMVTVGDVDFQAALGKVSAITPVPGGVGPVTVAMLLENTITCAKLLG